MTLPGVVTIPPPTPATPATPQPTPSTTSSKTSWFGTLFGKLVTPWGLRVTVVALLALTWGGAAALNAVQWEPAWPGKLGQVLAPLIFTTWMFVEFTVALGEKKILPHLFHLTAAVAVSVLLTPLIIKSLGLPDFLINLWIIGMATVALSYIRKEEWEISDTWKITNKIPDFFKGIMMGGIFLGTMFIMSIGLGR